MIEGFVKNLNDIPKIINRDLKVDGKQ